MLFMLNMFKEPEIAGYKICMDAFPINFTYQGVAYSGIVKPQYVSSKHYDNGQITYLVKLESGNQEDSLTILAKTADPGTGVWKFQAVGETDPPGKYGKEFLQEIGEAIEKHISSST